MLAYHTHDYKQAEATCRLKTTGIEGSANFGAATQLRSLSCPEYAIAEIAKRSV
jgi:hypothetical protein